MRTLVAKLKQSQTTRRDPNMSGMTADIETITPEAAKLRLESTSVRNRSLGARHVNRIASDMNSGDFRFNGEALIHDEDGNILDGQHRYAACVLAGVPFTSVVVRGVPRSAFATIDSGIKRTASHVLTIAGHNYTTMLASAGVRLYAYRVGNLAPANGSSKYYTGYSNLSAAQLAEYVDSLGEDFISSAAWAQKNTNVLRGLKPLAPGFLTMIVHELGDREHLGREFFERVASGAGLAVGSPELALRNYLTSMLALSPHRRAHSVVVAACAVKALNASLEGREVKLLRYSDKEGFPKIGAVTA